VFDAQTTVPLVEDEVTEVGSNELVGGMKLGIEAKDETLLACVL